MTRTIVLMASLLAAPAFAAAPDTSGPWEPPGPEEEVLGLGTVHPRDERPHEYLQPVFSLDWQFARRLAENMVCELGVIALGLEHCSAWAELEKAQASPVEAPEPDWKIILRRPVEQRRRSI